METIQENNCSEYQVKELIASQIGMNGNDLPDNAIDFILKYLQNDTENIITRRKVFPSRSSGSLGLLVEKQLFPSFLDEPNIFYNIRVPL